MIKKILHAAPILATVAALAGCGASEPSEAEMFDVLGSGPTSMMFGDAEKLAAQAKKTGCEKLGEKTFKCGLMSKSGKGMVMNYSFVKIDGKWMLTQ